jgi:hygromycin-B 4-O-kinase
MLAQDGKITAVLDWLDAGYGDFVYDLAVLDFWSPWLDIREASQAYHQQRQRELPFYSERLLCHECRQALEGLAKSDHKEGYQMTRTLILAN